MTTNLLSFMLLCAYSLAIAVPDTSDKERVWTVFGSLRRAGRSSLNTIAVPNLSRKKNVGCRSAAVVEAGEYDHAGGNRQVRIDQELLTVRSWVRDTPLSPRKHIGTAANSLPASAEIATLAVATAAATSGHVRVVAIGKAIAKSKAAAA